MAYADALQDTVTISAVSIGNRVGDTIGEEVKTFTPLYTSVPCRLMNSGRNQRIERNDGSFESFKNIWLIQMEAQYDGASRGDQAVINGQEYIIAKKHEIRGDSSAIHHLVYYLEEKSDA